MGGISKERLTEIYNNFLRQNREYACAVNSIISECTDLDHRISFDANTQKIIKRLTALRDRNSLELSQQDYDELSS